MSKYSLAYQGNVPQAWNRAVWWRSLNFRLMMQQCHRPKVRTAGTAGLLCPRVGISPWHASPLFSVNCVACNMIGLNLRHRGSFQAHFKHLLVFTMPQAKSEGSWFVTSEGWNQPVAHNLRNFLSHFWQSFGCSSAPLGWDVWHAHEMLRCSSPLQPIQFQLPKTAGDRVAG